MTRFMHLCLHFFGVFWQREDRVGTCEARKEKKGGEWVGFVFRFLICVASFSVFGYQFFYGM